MAKKTKLVEIEIGCPECTGKGFVAHRHITNKRNKKKCPSCKGECTVKKLITVEYD